jgi:threonine aldolase
MIVHADLRSDTVTKPPPEMRKAMAEAIVGDDVLGDDPTVSELERLVAELTGKEAAMFVPSGTMSNQIAIACHCRPGDAILIEEDAHMIHYEVGGSAVIAGVVSWTLPSHRGAIAPTDIRRRYRKGDLHTPKTALLCLENTHNRAGGAVISQAHLADTRQLAHELGLSVHMDGARVWNAAVAQGVSVREIAQYADSISVCLSKGLRAPVGSVLCGPAEFMDRARIWRKRLGGGMRQAGILAAAGIISVTQMIDRLAKDHARAKRLAKAVAKLPGLQVDIDGVETNLVLVNTKLPADLWQERMEARGILFFGVAPNRFRMVTHADVDDVAIDATIEAFCAETGVGVGEVG